MAVTGVLPVFQTPFYDDSFGNAFRNEQIDYDTLEHEINWLFDCGSDGIVMAMVSEVLRLSGEERKALAEAACRFGLPRGSVTLSVGAESSFVAEAFARHAESVGATAVMAIPPVSIAIDEDELRRYYERILNAVSIPVIVQDASGYVGRPMSIALQAALFNHYGPRVLFKPEAEPIGPRLTALRDATNGAAPVFEGSGGIALVDSFRRGIVGTMPGADLIDAIVALWRALQADDEATVARIHAPLAKLISLQKGLDGFLAVEKHLLRRRGIFKNTVVRGPIGFVLDEATRHEVDRLFDLLQAELTQ